MNLTEVFWIFHSQKLHCCNVVSIAEVSDVIFVSLRNLYNQMMRTNNLKNQTIQRMRTKMKRLRVVKMIVKVIVRMMGKVMMPRMLLQQTRKLIKTEKGRKKLNLKRNRILVWRGQGRSMLHVLCRLVPVIHCY